MEMKDLVGTSKRCVKDAEAPCMTSCPFNVDVRNLTRRIRVGNFNGAFSRYKKQVIFPEIVSRICPHYCANTCAETNKNLQVDIGSLELAACRFHDSGSPNYATHSKKSEKIAIVGGGLAGCTAAFLLTAKGYQVELFERNSRLGGSLSAYPEQILPPYALEQDFLQLYESDNLTIRCNTKVSSLNELDFDAVLLATGTAGNPPGAALQDWNPLTLQSSVPNVFYAGKLVLAENAGDIRAMVSARQASESVDRFLQGVSLTLDRTIPNYGKATDISSSPAPVRELSREEAITEAANCTFCYCNNCLSCPLLGKYKETPKEYAAEVLQNLNVIERLDAPVNKRMIYSCNLCHDCSSVCPVGIDMGEVFLLGRRMLHKKGKTRDAIYDYWLRDMVFQNTEAGLLKKQPGKEECAYLFFPGCQLGGVLPDTLRRTYKYLCHVLAGGVALKLGCCGAPADWSGDEALYAQVRDSFLQDWLSLDKPQVIIACPSCASLLQRELPEIPLLSLWDILAKHIPPQAIYGNNRQVSVFDPCTSDAAGNSAESARSILHALSYQPVHIERQPGSGTCCGYGGLISAVDPELAEEITNQRVSASPYDYVTYCINCQDTFLSVGKNSRHLLELLFDSTSFDEASSIPTLTERRASVLKLKKELLSELWNEDWQPPAEPECELLISDDLWAKMQKSRILLADIQKVIINAEQNHCYFIRETNGAHIASLRQGPITYWAEYSVPAAADPIAAFKLLNVYTHRMELQEADASTLKSDANTKVLAEISCGQCSNKLEIHDRNLFYLDHYLQHGLPCCHECGRIYIPEELATGKMQEVEMAFEDK